MDRFDNWLDCSNPLACWPLDPSLHLVGGAVRLWFATTWLIALTPWDEIDKTHTGTARESSLTSAMVPGQAFA